MFVPENVTFDLKSQNSQNPENPKNHPKSGKSRISKIEIKKVCPTSISTTKFFARAFFGVFS